MSRLSSSAFHSALRTKRDDDAITLQMNLIYTLSDNNDDDATLTCTNVLFF